MGYELDGVMRSSLVLYKTCSWGLIFFFSCKILPVFNVFSCLPSLLMLSGMLSSVTFKLFSPFSYLLYECPCLWSSWMEDAVEGSLQSLQARLSFHLKGYLNGLVSTTELVLLDSILILSYISYISSLVWDTRWLADKFWVCKQKNSRYGGQ